MLLFVDGVVRIIPEDVDPKDSDVLKTLTNEIPGSLTSISPIPWDIDVEDVDIQRMDKAFRYIAKSLPLMQKGNFELIIGEGGTVSILGHVYLHQMKLSERVRESLIKNNLINLGITEIVRSLGAENYFPVPEKVSNLILSYIANRISRRVGLDSVTDEDLTFTVNSLDRLEVSQEIVSGTPEGALLSAIISTTIPEELGRLPPREIRELRDAYAGIREVFQAYLPQLALRSKLYRISDLNLFRDRINEISYQINSECEKLRSAVWARRFKGWGPFAVCTLFTVGATLIDPAYGFTFAAGNAGVEFLKKVFFKEQPENVEVKACHMLADLKTAILDRAKLDALI